MCDVTTFSAARIGVEKTPAFTSREALNKSKFQIHIQATERFCLPTCRRGRIIAPSSRKLLVF